MKGQDQRTNSQKILQNAVSKIKRALIPNYKKNELADELVDSVRVRLVGNIGEGKTEQYLEEIAQGTHTYDDYGEYKMLRRNRKEQKNHQLIYDAVSGSLQDHTKKVATTVGEESKKRANMQAFIMDKDGGLYKATHTNDYDVGNPSLTHASFLSGKPAEMAGLISINANGKIDLITNDSGHYAPEILDMYRGIKKLQQKMPSAFELDCKIEIFGLRTVTVENFIKIMEAPFSDVEPRPRHEILREQRKEDLKKYDEDLKTAVSIKIDGSAKNLINSLAKLSAENKEKLKGALTNPISRIFVMDSDGKTPIFIPLTALTTNIINLGNSQAMKVLLDSGISKRQEFHNARPIGSAILQGNEAMVATLLENEDVRRSLVIEKDSQQLSILHLAAEGGNEKIINSILKYSEGLDLLSMKDDQGLTPRQLAHRRGFSEVELAIREGELSLVKDQLANYFEKEMQGKETITTAHQTKMKEKIIAKLLPLALNKSERQEINSFAGSIVREAAKIAGNKLDFHQKIIKIIKRHVSTSEKHQFANIVNDPKLSKILKHLKESKAISLAPSGAEIPKPPHLKLPSNNNNDRGSDDTIRARWLKKTYQITL